MKATGLMWVLDATRRPRPRRWRRSRRPGPPGRRWATGLPPPGGEIGDGHASAHAGRHSEQEDLAGRETGLFLEPFTGITSIVHPFASLVPEVFPAIESAAMDTYPNSSWHMVRPSFLIHENDAAVQGSPWPDVCPDRDGGEHPRGQGVQGRIDRARARGWERPVCGDERPPGPGPPDVSTWWSCATYQLRRLREGPALRRSVLGGHVPFPGQAAQQLFPHPPLPGVGDKPASQEAVHAALQEFGEG